MAFDDLKGVPGLDGPNTITTEITSVPRSNDKAGMEDRSPKARKLLGLFRRTTVEEDNHKRSLVDESELGINNGPNLPSRISHSTDVTAPNGITVQYDIRRTVEDAREQMGESTSSLSGDRVSIIEEENFHRRHDFV